MNPLQLAIYEYQTFVLPMLRRQRAEQRDRAATKIQSAVRRLLAQREAERLRTEKNAATVIQAHVRGFQARQQAIRRRNAATVIQAHMRGAKVRQTVGMKEEILQQFKLHVRAEMHTFAEGGYWDAAQLGALHREFLTYIDEVKTREAAGQDIPLEAWRHGRQLIQNLIDRICDNEGLNRDFAECRIAIDAHEGQQATNLEKIFGEISDTSTRADRNGLQRLLTKFSDKVAQYAASEKRVAAASSKAAFSAQCDAVYLDMKKQFRQSNGTSSTRGAYYGASRPGSKQKAKSVPTNVIAELKIRVQGTTWRFSDSFTSGLSFHRAQSSGIDFIYHMNPPAG